MLNDHLMTHPSWDCEISHLTWQVQRSNMRNIMKTIIMLWEQRSCLNYSSCLHVFKVDLGFDGKMIPYCYSWHWGSKTGGAVDQVAKCSTFKKPLISVNIYRSCLTMNQLFCWKYSQCCCQQMKQNVMIRWMRDLRVNVLRSFHKKWSCFCLFLKCCLIDY